MYIFYKKLTQKNKRRLMLTNSVFLATFFILPNALLLEKCSKFG